jgi:hypothetical protein
MRALLLCAALIPFVAAAAAPGSSSGYGGRPYWEWPLGAAVEILNSSPWARHETFTRVVGGIGSGISGEKEIYNTFYVRFLSALPVREAYARVQQLQHRYSDLSPEKRKLFDATMQRTLDMDVDRWIVIALGFRSNDPNEESAVRRFLQSQTTETLKTSAFLSTPEFPQVALAAYYAPREESVGARFVFPREIGGAPLVNGKTSRVTFELLEVPGADRRLMATFPIDGMTVNGRVIL